MEIETGVRTGGTMNERLVKIIEKVSKKHVKVGLPADAGTHEDTGESIAAIARVHEYGAVIDHPAGYKIIIPQRSFLRVPLRAQQDRWIKVMKEGMNDVMEGVITMEQLLDQVGAAAVGISQEAIHAGIMPDNAESTKARKDSATPLIDQGFLWQNITFVVEDRRPE